MAKANNSDGGFDLPECPVCMETLLPPIFQCTTGHSLCNSCTKKLNPFDCPLCRQPMTTTRNRGFEEIVSKKRLYCPNKIFGCSLFLLAKNYENHLKVCVFRDMDCPVKGDTGAAGCSWQGQMKQISAHCNECHPTHCPVTSEIEIANIYINRNAYHTYLLSEHGLVFILTMKIDVSETKVYWTVRLLGTIKVAKQYCYEILLKLKNLKKQVKFIEQCFHVATNANDIFGSSKCASMPLDMLSHFIAHNKVLIHVTIKKLAAKETEENNDADTVNSNDSVKPIRNRRRNRNQSRPRQC